MTNAVYKMFLGALLTTTMAGGTFGCSSETSSADDKTGELSVPLTAYAPSGVKYRLRNANFEISGYGDGGVGGAPNSPNTIVVSSEEDPEATSISVNLETGLYSLALQPGWSMEQVGPDGATTVEATLLTSPDWVYVAPRVTNWAEYHFGVGDRELWLNGNLNIDMHVWDDPDQVGGYGNGGNGGSSPYPDDGGYGNGGAGGSSPYPDGGYGDGGAGGSSPYPEDGQGGGF